MEDNNKMDFREISCEGKERMKLIEDTVQLRVSVRATVHLLVP
jgi:hypothetical protein